MRDYPVIRWPFVAVTAAVLSVIAVGLVAATVPAQTLPPPPPPSFEAEHSDLVPAGFDRRKQAIEQALAAEKTSRWAGNYYEGDGLGANIILSLAPDAGAVTTWTGCLGLYAANHGLLTEGADGVIRMSYVAPNDTTRIGFPSELMPVSWGRRQYLIPPDKLVEFATAINHGREPRDDAGGFFLLRQGDEKHAASGLPSLPTSMLALLRREPVEVKTASVELRQHHKSQDGFCTSTYRLGVVASAEPVPPLFVGEQLQPLDGNNNASVVARQGPLAEAEIIVYECDDRFAPKPGARFTTGAYNDGKGARR